jgi:hypothetical protein
MLVRAPSMPIKDVLSTKGSAATFNRAFVVCRLELVDCSNVGFEVLSTSQGLVAIPNCALMISGPICLLVHDRFFVDDKCLVYGNLLIHDALLFHDNIFIHDNISERS